MFDINKINVNYNFYKNSLKVYSSLFKNTDLYLSIKSSRTFMP